MGQPYSNKPTLIQRIFNARTKHKLIQNRIAICIILTFVIVFFSLFGLSSDKIFDEEDQLDEIDLKTVGKPFGMSSYLNKKKNQMNDDKIENLIILPCHSIFSPELNDDVKSSKDLEDSNNWLMEPFQLESNDQISFLKHIEISFNELHENIEDSILVISGGFTKPQIKKSESSSYLEAAEKLGLLNMNINFLKDSNVLLEEYARDSYENVLYSILTFYKKFSKFPKKITVVGFGFKRERFLAYHLTTLGYYNSIQVDSKDINYNHLPDGKHSKYIDVGPFLVKPDDLSDAEFSDYEEKFWIDLLKSEKTNALNLFKENPFGSKTSKLNEKKIKRDPWKMHSKIFQFYSSGNKIVNNLLKIDELEINSAWELYKQKILPELPLYE